MAEKPNISTRQFDKQLNEDVRDYHSRSNAWSYARNAINNSVTGDLGDLGNEPSNYFCTQAPYSIIGVIYLYGDTFAIFSTDDTNSEIGLFTESTCTYVKIVNDPCLNFNRTNLITGSSKENFDCSWHLYWSDNNRNPDRTLNINKVPYIQNCVTVNNCITCTDTTQLDCDKIRMARLVQAPCMSIKKGASGGNLLNGSYFVTLAYTINGQRVTDYFTPSIAQALFSHSNVAGSVDIELSNLDKTFDEFELVIISVINQQTQAKKLGIYNTRQTQVTVDIIDNKLIDIPIELIPVHNPIADSSDAIYEVGNYLLRIGPTEKFDFNYQPLANQIVSKWQAMEYAADYYRKGGNQTGYLRDENYAFFIQWVYEDGDLSSAYHIPGRAPNSTDLQVVAGADAQIEISEGIIPLRWMVENTASLTALYPPNTLAPDGIGTLLSEGLMGYWESTELYPDDKPTVFGNLCGQAIRHHKFPEQSLHTTVRHYNNTNNTIRIMGVKFENIVPPVDNSGILIPGIVGYRILRGSREGNKTIIAKGVINNLFQYAIENNTSTRQGLYPNYPYNDVRPDPYVSTADTIEVGCVVNATPNATVSPDNYTFHSPDTGFRNPFLSVKEVKVYGELNGTTEGVFVQPDKHPKHKFLTDLAFIISAIAGIGIAAIEMNGERRTSYVMPRKRANSNSGTTIKDSNDIQETVGDVTSTYSLVEAGDVDATIDGDVNAVSLGNSTSGTLFTFLQGLDNITSSSGTNATMDALSGADTATGSMIPVIDADNTTFWTTGGQLVQNLLGSGPNTSGTGYNSQLTTDTVSYGESHPAMDGLGITQEQTAGKLDNIPAWISAINGFVTFVYYWSQGTDATLDLIRALLPYRQYALQFQSHCFYDGFQNPQANNHRRLITDSAYLDNQLQDYGANFRVNNLNRSKSVILSSQTGFNNTLATDNSKQTVGTQGAWSNPLVPFKNTAASHYASLKNRLRNQYGQIGGIQQIPVGCVNLVTITSPSNTFITPVLNGGDTYVTRYTEKNTMFFFYDWLYDQPDGYEFDYHIRKMLPFPTYWMNSQKFDTSEFINNLTSTISGGSGSGWNSFLPSGQHAFDRGGCTGFFEVKEAYMYLFNSGVRDFFVESEINTDLRDWGDLPEQRFYDPYQYTDLNSLFRVPIIKSGDYYKYDYSLSVSKTFINFISWANIQPINYDPAIYATCYTHYPNRIIYSLPQQFELIKDNWLIYLANNYKDFKTHVRCVKPINKSGALIYFDTESPIQFLGVDELQTSAGTKITIGDGGLFSQPLQNLMTSDKPYEYGSCQDKYSIISTPMGLFWISQNQGKIFQLQNGIQEISMTDLKWWFAQYLPYFITKDFPNFQLLDNPVIGVGCQSIYDNENCLVYFTKRDFKVRTDITDVVTYVSNDNFLVNGSLPIKLGDPAYFEDVSWTVSYDPKTRNWVSWHDWHPTFLIPGKNTFLSVLDNTLWVHNAVCNSYCNYYGVNYPFEIEYRVNTVQQVNTVRSVEIQMENYIYDANCHDRWHDLEFFFDEAVVFNTEQVSGLLKLNQTPNNDPYALLNYPITNFASIDILYSKIENKYRFNMFDDITDDRGEFTNAKRMIWNTASNGYARTLNSANLNYTKDPFQRKKFRHYTTNVLLRRKVSGNRKILLMLTNNKDLYSPR